MATATSPLDISATGSASALAAAVTPESIYNVLPPADGKALLILHSLQAIGFGAVLVELFSHLHYDWQLIRKPGWTQPAKLVSRLAYLICRIVPPFILGIYVLYFLLKGLDCRAAALTVNVLTMVCFDAVVLIFVARTMALYSWKRTIVIPLTVYYAVLLTTAAISVPFWGVGYLIPGTEFCAFNTRRHETRTIVTNLLYKTLSMGLDLILLLLTLHRLLDGGLPSILQRRSRRQPGALNGQGISSILLQQGFHFYVLQLASDLFLVVSWFHFKEMTYQGIGGPFAYSVPPIAAAAAFRNVGRSISRTTDRNAFMVNEIMDSSDPSSSDKVPFTGAALSAVGHSAVNASKGDTPHLSHHAQQGAGSVAHPGRTPRIMWGSKTNLLSRAQLHHTDVENRGILVTVGTVSRTDAVDHHWRIDSPRSSSDNATAIDTQGRRPKLTPEDRTQSSIADADSTHKSEF